MSPTNFSYETDGILHIKSSTTGVSFPLQTHDIKVLLGDDTRSSTNVLRLARQLGIDPHRELSGFRGAREFGDADILAFAKAKRCQIVDHPEITNIVVVGPTGARAVIPKTS